MQHLPVALFNEHEARSLYGRNSRFMYNLEECLQMAGSFYAHYLLSQNLGTVVLGFLSLLKEDVENGLFCSQRRQTYKKHVVRSSSRFCG
jgi:hypothetical protein